MRNWKWYPERKKIWIGASLQTTSGHKDTNALKGFPNLTTYTACDPLKQSCQSCLASIRLTKDKFSPLRMFHLTFLDARGCRTLRYFKKAKKKNVETSQVYLRSRRGGLDPRADKHFLRTQTGKLISRLNLSLVLEAAGCLTQRRFTVSVQRAFLLLVPVCTAAPLTRQFKW